MAEEVSRVNEAIGHVNAQNFAAAAHSIKDIPEDSQIWTQEGPATIKGVVLWKHHNDLENALIAFNHVIEANPNDTAARQNADAIQIEMKIKAYQHACELQQKGLYDLTYLNAAADAYCEIDLDEPITNEIRFHVANNFGNTLQMLGRKFEALQAFETALEMEPMCFEANFNRGVLLKNEERWDEALDSFVAALVTNPSSPQAILGRLDCLANLWRIEELLEVSTQVIDEELMENDYHPYYFRGFAKTEMEDYQDAIPDLELGLSIGGIIGDEFRKMEHTTVKAYAKYGELMLMGGDSETAVDYFDGSLKYKPGNADLRVVMFNKALALIQLDKIDDAIKQLKETLQKFPDHRQAREALGQLYLMLEMYDLATQELALALDDPEPDQADLMYNLGIAYFKRDRIADARDTFLRTLNLDPDHPPAKKALEAMEKLLTLKKANHRDAHRVDRDFVAGPFTENKDGYSWSGNGYHKNFIPGEHAGEKEGYAYLPKGTRGAGYYRLPEDQPYFIPGENTGDLEKYTYRAKGNLGPGYYLNDEELPLFTRNFKIQSTGTQDLLIKRDDRFDDDPEIARLQRLGWSDEIINSTFRIRRAASLKQEEIFESGGGVPTADYISGKSDKGATVGVENLRVAEQQSTPGQQTAAAEEPVVAASTLISTAFTPITELAVPYEDLKSPGPYPSGVNPAERELYLSDNAFHSFFGMSKDDFQAAPKWKRTNMKKKHGLF